MDRCCVVFEMHEAFGRVLGTGVIGKWAALARLKLMVPVEVALQRMLAVARADAATHRRCNADIGKVGIGVEIDLQAGRRNLSIPI